MCGVLFEIWKDSKKIRFIKCIFYPNDERLVGNQWQQINRHKVRWIFMIFWKMASIYEEVEIEDMEYNPETQIYTYPCPCGDKFQISLEDLHDGEDIGTCPSCTLRIKVIFEEDSLPPLPSVHDEEEGDGIS